jgi:hypothetical protein
VSEQSSALQANSAETIASRGLANVSAARNTNRAQHPAAATLHAYYGDQQQQPQISTAAFDSINGGATQPSESSHSFINRQLPANRQFGSMQPGNSNGLPSAAAASAGSASNCDTNGRPMVVALNRTVMAHIGQQITVVAVFCCEPRPRKVLWIHRHLALQPASTVLTYTASELYMVICRSLHSLCTLHLK